jgi:aryl-alcohol dehydrogenase-like predicted oxidoreductase
MQKRLLGKTNLEVVPLVFGGNVFGWTVDEAQSHKLLNAFVGMGFNFIDTANVYSTWVPGNRGGESETIIGNWLKANNKRHQVILATKVGMEMGDGSSGLRKENIIQSAENSLKRLKTDVIDLYQSHRDDENTPLEETLEAYQTLIQQGKVRAIGASNYSASRLKKALDLSKEKGLPLYSSLQPEYNLYDRAGFEDGLEHLCMKYGLAVISYYSLASGFLTGKYRSEKDLQKSIRGSNVGKRYLNPRGMRILAALDEVAQSHHCSLAAVSLAWLLHRKSITAPIASATRVEQIKEFAQAVTLKLDAQQIKCLDEASAI